MINPTAEHFPFSVITRQQLGDSAREIGDDLVEAWGTSAPSDRTIRRWFLEYGTGDRASLSDCPRSGRPRSSRTDDLMNQVDALISDNPRLSTRDLSGDLSFD